MIFWKTFCWILIFVGLLEPSSGKISISEVILRALAVLLKYLKRKNFRKKYILIKSIENQ